jgi:flagellar assembly factor FliW
MAGNGHHIQFQSRRFGTVSVRSNTVITFPHGLVGMSELTRFALLEGSGPLQWLQSLDDPDATFVVMPMDQVVDGAIDPSGNDLKRVGADGDLSALLILVLVTVPQESPGEPTVNLMAPLLIHPDTRFGVQAILSEQFPLRHPVTELFQAEHAIPVG